MKKAVVIGSLNLDYSLAVAHLPLPGETILAQGLTMNPGGKGANQAYALGKLGCETSMIGSVGTDNAGALLCGNLESVGVDTSGIKRLPDVPSGQAFIPVDASGQNSIIVLSGANALVTPRDIDQEKARIEQADCVVMQLEIPIETVLYAAKLAKSLGKTVVLDPAPARSDLPDELIGCADFIKPNETELAILTGRPSETIEDCREAAELLLQKGAGTVMVSLGSKGVLAVSRKGTVHVPARKVKAVDTTAAGDCFTAAFVRAYEGDTEKALQFATAAAAIAVSRKGAQASIPTAEEVE